MRAFRDSEGALYAADAGLRYTMAMWNSYSPTSLNPGDSLVVNGNVASGWQSLSTTAAKYRAVIHRVDNSVSGNATRAYLLVVQGRGATKLNGQRAIEAVITSTAPTFQYAAYTPGTMTFSGGNGTDTVVTSYNSATGVTGHMGNLASGGNMSLQGVVNGDVSTAGTISGGVNILGDSTVHATGMPTYANPTCPAIGYPPANHVLDASGNPSANYNATTGELKNPGTDITLTGQTTFLFSNIIGNKHINIDPGVGSVTIYLNGQLDISGGGVVNATSKPTQLSVSACGTNTSNWTLSGSSNAYMSLYAPTHALTISGTGELYGAVISASLTASGGSTVHFDEALLGSTTTLVLIAGSWTELTVY